MTISQWADVYCSARHAIDLVNDDNDFGPCGFVVLIGTKFEKLNTFHHKVSGIVINLSNILHFTSDFNPVYKYYTFCAIS